MIDWWLGGPLDDGGHLVWRTSELWLTLAIVGGVFAFIIAVWTGSKDKSPVWKRVLELGVWALALTVLVVTLARPAWVSESGRSETAPLVVLVDSSASMNLEELGIKRSEEVGPILELLEDAHGDGPIQYFHFDHELRVGKPDLFQGADSDLGVALAAVQDRFLGQDVRGVVVLTDGLDRGSLRQGISNARDTDGVSTKLAPKLPGPLTVYQIGSDSGLMDVSIQDVISGGYAFQRTPFQLRAAIEGPPGQTVPVTLEKEGSLVETIQVQLDEQGQGEALFEHSSSKTGRFAYEVSTPVQREDAVPGNNRYPVVVRVVREKMRVLQVCGSPSYDQKFLRLFLQEDPSVDLVSFFILRTNEDLNSQWRSRELSLIEFPYQRLFLDDLDDFDLVVLQNFDYEPYFRYAADRLLGNIADSVRDGDIALVMTGGDRSFDLGNYAGTPIENILPVRLGLQGSKTDLGKFRPVLTDAGLAHPISRLAGTGEASEEIWERLPPMDGLNLAAGAHPDAAVLLAHPDLRGQDGAPAPVVAVREVGKGRTMALMVDASWRWSFSEAAVGRGNQAYLRFWKNSMRWLLADPTDRRIVVEPSRENVLLNETVRLVAKVRDPGFQPMADETVTVVVVEPDGQKVTEELQTDVAGEVVLEFQPQTRGPHRVEVRVGDEITDRAETVFAATDRDPELSEIRPDVGFTQQLVELYGDEGAWRARGSKETALVNSEALQRVPEAQERSLSFAPIVALVFGLLSGLAWWIRRRAGGL